MLFTYLVMTGYISLIMFLQLISNNKLRETQYPWVVVVVVLAFCLIWPISLWGWLKIVQKGLLEKVNNDDKNEKQKGDEEEVEIPASHRLEYDEDVTVEGDRFFIYGDLVDHAEVIHFVTLSQLMLKSGMTEDEAEKFLFVEQWARELDRTTFENLQRKCWRVWDRNSIIG